MRGDGLWSVWTEISFWRPINDFHKDKYDHRQNVARLVKNQLQGDLAFRVGVSFQTAVKSMLVGTAVDGEASESQQIIDFFAAVVSRVGLQGLQ